jgi:hypothetical protein
MSEEGQGFEKLERERLIAKREALLPESSPYLRVPSEMEEHICHKNRRSSACCYKYIQDLESEFKGVSDLLCHFVEKDIACLLLFIFHLL